MSIDPSAGGRDPFAAGPLDRATAIDLVHRADALVAQGEYEQAAPFYGRVIGHADPDLHVAALLGIAECRYRTDQDDAAVEAWRLATQAPDTPLTWVAWRQLAAARIRQGDLQGALDAYRQADRRAPPEARAEIASRLGWLNKELGNSRAAGRYFGRARQGGGGQPVVTWAILAVTIAIGLIEILGALAGTGDPFTPLLYLDKQAVARGEVWRLLTVVLTHEPTNPLHLAFNMYALYLVGPLVERIYGRAQYLLMYVLCGIAASVTSFIFLPDPAVGASGAIFGLFGALFVALRVHHPLLGRGAAGLARQIGLLIVLNLVLDVGLIGGGVGIDIYAHIGGLVAGAWLALVLLPSGITLASLWQRPGTASSGGAAAAAPQAARWLGVLALVVVIVAGLQVGMGIRNWGTGRILGPSAVVADARFADVRLSPVSLLAAGTATGREAGRAAARSGR